MMKEPEYEELNIETPKKITTWTTSMNNYVLEYIDHSNVMNLEKWMMIHA